MTQAPRKFEDLAVEAKPALSDADLPFVCVIVVNCDGRSMLETCLGTLDQSDYPKEKVRVVVVDNGSRDSSVNWLRRQRPSVHVVANDRNVGFTPACNQGVAASDGASVLVFLNNDVRVEPKWLRELVSPVARGDCAATGAKMLDPNGERLDHAGGGTNYHGIAVASGYGEVAGPEHDIPRRCLFACGGAMAMDAAAYKAIGGFDDEFFAYYDDLDIGWRTNLAGYQVHYAPAAVCRHDHSGTSRRFPKEQIRLLQVRNALLCCVFNYGDEFFDALWPTILSVAVRRHWVFTRITDVSEFRIEETHLRNAGPMARLKRSALAALGQGQTYPIDRISMGDLVGINDVLGRWDHWMERRAQIQALRKTPDKEILPLFENPLWCIEGEAGYVQLQESMLRRAGLYDLLASHEREGPVPFK